MKKLSLDKFRIMKLNNLSKVRGGDPTNDGGDTRTTTATTEDELICVSGSVIDVLRDEAVNFPTTKCPY